MKSGLALLILPLPLIAQELPEIVRHIDSADLMRHVRILSDDSFGGRAPASEGEEMTVDYLVGEWRRRAWSRASRRELDPGGPAGGGERSSSRGELVVAGSRVPLQAPQDYVAWTGSLEERTDLVESPMVFVGYGVEARSTAGTTTRTSTARARPC